MVRYLILGSAAALLALPADAQSNYRTRTVIVYGDDPCPRSDNPDEIIVCARQPEEERFRIPKELREAERAANIAREDNVATNRAQLASGRDSASGPGSCSTAGPGGTTGCTPGLNIPAAIRTAREGIGRALEPTDD
ncbi:MAG: hypothetical protein SNJ79_14325 [Sphingomonadaceae bacterium]